MGTPYDNTTDGPGLIEGMTLDELKRLDTAYDWSADDGLTSAYRGQGIQVPTLEAVLWTLSHRKVSYRNAERLFACDNSDGRKTS